MRFPLKINRLVGVFEKFCEKLVKKLCKERGGALPTTKFLDSVDCFYLNLKFLDSELSFYVNLKFLDSELSFYVNLKF